MRDSEDARLASYCPMRQGASSSKKKEPETSTCEMQRIRTVVVIFLLIVISSIILQKQISIQSPLLDQNHERCEISLYSGSNFVVPWRKVAGSEAEVINIVFLIVLFLS